MGSQWTFSPSWADGSVLTAAQLTALSTAISNIFNTAGVQGQSIATNTITTSNIAAGAITTTLLGASAVTLAKMAANSVGVAQIIDDSVTSSAIADGEVNSAHLATSVAGAGLAGGGGTALSVNVDDSTIEINSDTLRVKDAGITLAKQAAVNIATGSHSGTYSNATTSYVTACNVNFTPQTSTRPVMISLQCLDDNTALSGAYTTATLGSTCRVLIDGVQHFSFGINDGEILSSWMATTTMSASAHTIAFQFKNTGAGTVSVNYMNVVCIEL